jgi:hypothetical protein
MAAPPQPPPVYPAAGVTQQYGLAPRAPGAPNAGAQPAAPVGYGNVPAPPPPRGQPSMPAPPQNSMGMYGSQRMPPAVNESPFDAVTIALAVLAFMSVACLIPLYLAVLQARMGG